MATVSATIMYTRFFIILAPLSQCSFRLKVGIVGSWIECAYHTETTSSVRFTAKTELVYNRIICRYKFPSFINLTSASYDPTLIVFKSVLNSFCWAYDLLVKCCRLTKRLFGIGGIRSFKLAYRIDWQFLIPRIRCGKAQVYTHPRVIGIPFPIPIYPHIKINNFSSPVRMHEVMLLNVKTKPAI